MVVMPVTVDSKGLPNVRVATGFPACAPTSVRFVTLTSTFSVYGTGEAQTWIMSPDIDAATAAPMV